MWMRLQSKSTCLGSVDTPKERCSPIPPLSAITPAMIMQPTLTSRLGQSTYISLVPGHIGSRYCRRFACHADATPYLKVMYST